MEFTINATHFNTEIRKLKESDSCKEVFFMIRYNIMHIMLKDTILDFQLKLDFEDIDMAPNNGYPCIIYGNLSPLGNLMGNGDASVIKGRIDPFTGTASYIDIYYERPTDGLPHGVRKYHIYIERVDMYSNGCSRVTCDFYPWEYFRHQKIARAIKSVKATYLSKKYGKLSDRFRYEYGRIEDRLADAVNVEYNKIIKYDVKTNKLGLIDSFKDKMVKKVRNQYNKNNWDTYEINGNTIISYTTPEDCVREILKNISKDLRQGITTAAVLEDM